ncbi:phosphatidylinositol 3-kinase, putative [Ichthyophthirius multifiliis]|uniref:phosphatidylinositol 3-kinase n=1 Tax=Ichthyophthirius multifiliis TaxID=5932 RepID=G0R4M8_ICHMU|nr:phosphatidylinositol 3-kinase, putative [Ichthyophthirius multifiliis]EGR27588.1 phosphatidylinositol 3-kinase, putative [Ichthyophthirius multifiliis]|eukprot:XP_004025040.1 phosphatidylinositol 3-kinase, putative [Ichthyophthirius multifiliis]
MKNYFFIDLDIHYNIILMLQLSFCIQQTGVRRKKKKKLQNYQNYGLHVILEMPYIYYHPYESVLLIRKYACENLEKCDDNIICSFLLQLVQALRYEPFDYQKSYLAQFLIEKAGKNTEISILLYWYIFVECDNSGNINQIVSEWYNQVLQCLKEFLLENNSQNFEVLQTQIAFREDLQKMVKSLKGKERPAQIEIIKQTLKDDKFKHPQFQKHPFCLNPKLILVESIHEKSTVFKSAMAPIKMTFLTHPVDNPQQKCEVEMIYKNGDDLRQDQLVMQIFNLMDNLLKGVSQDFKLMPYKVLACSKSDGFMQFVPNSTTIQEVLSKDKNISNYFEKLIQNPKNPLYDNFRDKGEEYIQKLIQEKQIQQQIMENYMLSCAGYSVMTYFLGVGDRHLENLMIDFTGKFFHIDFGFILGQDPKPYAPPLKLCKQMVEGMGGVQSKVYQDFKKKCVNAYIYLRKYAKLIVNLFYLMIDSGIKDINIEALEKLVDKFNLDSNDQQVELHFLNILEESVSALFPIINDIIHRWAGYWRA